MEATIAAALIAALASIASALIAALNASASRRRDEQEQARERLDAATANGLLAIMDALDVSLAALDHEHLNGEVKQARANMAKAKSDYQAARTDAVSRLV